METSSNITIRTSARRFHALLGLALVLSMVAFTLVTPGAAPVQAYEATPTGTATALLQASGLLIVRGEGFTPGGRVEIVIVDAQENQLHEPVWTSAAVGGPFGADGLALGNTGVDAPGSFVLVVHLEGTTLYGPNGSQDPANGYQTGIDASGLITAESVIVRAHDESADIWSGFAIEDTGSRLEVRTSIAGQAPTCAAVHLCGQPY